MNIVIITFWIALAVLTAVILALFTIGAAEIFRFAEKKYRGYGIAVILLSWFILLPIMVLLSVLVGLYKYITVMFPHFQNRKPESY